MSAERASAARASPPASRSTTITDADLLKLFPPTCADNKNALILVSKLKVLARGKRVIGVYNCTLRDELGWSPSTLKRAKRALEEAGLTMTEKRAPQGHYKGLCEYVLDRSWVPALRGSELTGGAVSPDPYTTEEKIPSGRDHASLRSLPEGRPPPCTSPGPLGRPGDAPDENENQDAEVVQMPPAGVPPEVRELEREWRALTAELGDEARAQRRLVHMGRDPWVLQLAVAVARHEDGGDP